jgi:hypothetical protein
LPDPEDSLKQKSERESSEIFQWCISRFALKLKSMACRQFLLKTAIFTFVALTSTLPSASARNKAKAPAPDTNKDQIDVLANLSVTGGPITRFTMTRHQSRSYLYIEHASHALTLVDVTDANHPTVVANLDTPAAGAVLTAAGDAALITSEDTPATAVTPKPKTMTIVSFADRAHPQTIRQFNKVTCTALDDARGLVYVANDDGLWILHRNPSEDAELQASYARQVVYQ